MGSSIVVIDDKHGEHEKNSDYVSTFCDVENNKRTNVNQLNEKAICIVKEATVCSKIYCCQSVTHFRMLRNNKDVKAKECIS